MQNIKEFSTTIDGVEVKATFSDLVEQSNGSVILESGNTVVLATAVIGSDTKNNPGFFNLTVEYIEKFYASGEILGSRFNRREARPTEQAILNGRIIDRTIRPLFEHHIKNAVQVIVTVLALGDVDPGILGANAVSLALATSDIPWNGPIGCTSITKEVDGVKTFDLTVCGKDGLVNMIESGAHQATEAEFGEALEAAVSSVTQMEAWQKEIVSQIGKEKMSLPAPETPQSVKDLYAETLKSKLSDGILNATMSKQEIYDTEDEWAEIVEGKYAETEDYDQTKNVAMDYFHHELDHLVHQLALEHDRRVDGRGFDELRPLLAKAGGFSSMLHGSGIFYRGETHVLSVLTLGGPDDAHLIDGMQIKETKTFMHHYNFPPYSVGDVRRVGSTGRREIGHGALAEKALAPVIPSQAEFPYTVRVVSETMGSNGSSSQASICASTLAMMDGGVPIKAPVAGIAMGLIMDQNNSDDYRILTDPPAAEDHHGDMDFKVAGTRTGITAVQMDVKVGGIPTKILKEALEKAKAARLQILDTMQAEIDLPRSSVAPSAPQVLKIQIATDMIGRVIGKGGETIKGIQEETGANINIEEDGTVFVIGKGDTAQKALDRVAEITKEWKVGEKVEGEVIKILDGIGAIVKLSEYADGLVHISQIANFRIEKVEDYLKEGMKVPVTVTEVDKARDRIGLSIKKDNPDLIKQK